MHWGHSVTEDMIRWGAASCSLATDQENMIERDAFPESAIEAMENML